jgi:hypothetical protein
LQNTEIHLQNMEKEFNRHKYETKLLTEKLQREREQVDDELREARSNAATV